MFGAQNVQKFFANVLCVALGGELFCARDRHDAGPHTPDSRQSFAAVRVLFATTVSRDVQEAARSVPSQSVGSLHFSLAVFARSQYVRSGAGSSDEQAGSPKAPAATPKTRDATARARQEKPTPQF